MAVVFVFAIVFVFVSRMCQYFVSIYFRLEHVRSNGTLLRMTKIQSIFYLIIGLMFNLSLHGTCSVVMLSFLFINYGLRYLVDPKSTLFVWTTWIFNLCAAFISFHFDSLLSPKHGVSDWFNIPFLVFLDEVECDTIFEG